MPKTDNHRKVYVNERGVRVMRITEIIKVLAKDQLLVWANMIGLKGVKYKEEMERTSNIGTMFHYVTEEMGKGNGFIPLNYEEFGIKDSQSIKETQNALRSFFTWYEKNKNWFKVVFTEKVVVGERFGGTIDCGIQGIKDPNKVIFVDYKTSSDFFLTMFLQLAGYVSLYEEVYGPNMVEGVMVILADKKHGEKVRTRFISRENLEMFITCFECLYNTALTTSTMNRIWKSLSVNNFGGE